MKILIHYRHFPLAMGRYMHWALEELGHEVISCGYYSDGYIPWGDNYFYPQYRFPPTIKLPNVEQYPIESIKAEYDLVIQAGDTHWLSGRPKVPNVIIATDPHAVDYHPRLKHADLFVCMQNYYLNKDYGGKGYWMPYGADTHIHQANKEKQKYLKIDYDVTCIGLPYKERQEVLDRVRKEGFRVFDQLGLIYEEYRDIYHRSNIAFNHSSKLDLPARFWEGLSMRNLVITNRVPDLQDIKNIAPVIEEGKHYLAYSNTDEAVELIIKWASRKIETDHARSTMTQDASRKAQYHSWTRRMRDLITQVQKL